MEEKEKLRVTILEGTIQAFNRKGLKFTMDDIAGQLGMSKKTIYTVFRDKETMFFAMVDYMFDSIKESERQVLRDESFTTVEKIRRVLGVLPEGYKDIDFRQLYLLKDKYPVIYKQVEKRLETGWETTIQLLEQGMDYLAKFVERISGKYRVHVIGPAYASVGKVNDIYRKVLYLKHKDERVLQDIKNKTEKYIEVNSGFRKLFIQFDYI